MCFVYVLKSLKDGSYYVGSTREIVNRLSKHKTGGVKFTKSRLPIRLVFLKQFPNYIQARTFENKVKSWKKRKSIEKMFGKSDNIASNYWEIV